MPFEHNPNLQEIKLTDYPILSHLSNPSKGNLSCISVEGDRVSFEQNTFMPVRDRDYTLWVSEYHEDMVINYWALSFWTAIYKTDFLYDVLTNPALDNHLHLVGAEAYYANQASFKKEIDSGRIKGQIGYINMQFCGLEMQHNKYWRELITYPNHEVR